MLHAMRLPSTETSPFGDRLVLHRSVLDNGLEVFVLPDPSAAIVSYNTWFRVGSRDEVPGKTGLAHLLEHLMFIQTKNLAEGEFDRRIERAGGESNAATWVDWTTYHENLPSSELELAIEVESDRMSNLVLTAPRVASEKDVVLSERSDRVDDDAEGKAGETLYATAFGRRHPYGWPTIGWRKDIEGLTAADCRAFYRANYAPDRATLVVAGDVDVAKVLRKVQRAYGAIPAARVPRRAVPRPKPVPSRRVALALPTPTEKMWIAWAAPPFASRDHAVLTVLGQLLAGGRSSLLTRELCLESELTSEVRAGASPFEVGSIFDLQLTAREGVPVQKAATAATRILSDIAKRGVPKTELEKVKNRFELGFLSSLETIPGKAEQVGFSRLVTGDPAHPFRRLQEIESVTPRDVQAMATHLFQAPRTTVFLTPKRGRA